MRQLAMRFRGLCRDGSLEKWNEWLWDAVSCGIYTMRRFATTRRHDIDALQNAVTDGSSEQRTDRRHINRLKALKRSMCTDATHFRIPTCAESEIAPIAI